MNIRIIVDSTADIEQNLQDQFTMVPLTLRFGEEEFIDRVTINSRQFYEKLVESDVMPVTSQATPYAFQQAFREAVRDGYDVVAITVSSRLSGTWQSAMMAAEEFPGRVHVVDSRSVAIGSAILAEYALKLRDKGMTAGEIASELENKRNDICLIALLDTLEYLRRGGRISKTAAVAGELLSIKPVACIRDGEIILLGKARGSKNGNNLLIKEIQKAGGVDFDMPVLLGYTGLGDGMLKKYIRDSADLWESRIDTLRTTCIGSVIGTHAGPGAIAVAFFKNRA